MAALPLNALFASRLSRSVIIAIALVAWLGLSNHCALGRLANFGRINSEHACCHNGKAAGGPTTGQQQGVVCCKSIRALMPGNVKLAMGTPAAAVFAPEIFSLMGHVPTPAIACDTGPPRGRSFSELVLQRSLQAHAPPSVT
jgi:hypothetical protein